MTPIHQPDSLAALAHLLPFIHPPIVHRILPSHLRLRLPRNIAVKQHGLLLAEGHQRAYDGCICGGGGGGGGGGAKRHPMLLEDRRAENTKRSRWKVSSVGRCDRWASPLGENGGRIACEHGA